MWERGRGSEGKERGQRKMKQKRKTTDNKDNLNQSFMAKTIIMNYGKFKQNSLTL
jgi:hypothetical protein